jgi:hypothetical protein
MALFKKAPAGRGPEELRAAFLDACASIADIRAKCKKATETATDSELYRLAKQLSADLDPIFLYIDGILDEYLENQHGGRRPARVQ